MEEVFSAQSGWSDWVLSDAKRKLTVVLTGGGSQLPMVQDLASQDLIVGNRQIPVARGVAFPLWLQESFSEYEDIYPRIAVSLGGARKDIFRNQGRMTSAAPVASQGFELEKFRSGGS